MQLPDYRLDTLLSTGAHTRVFRGHDLLHDRAVIIKMLRPEHHVPEVVARLHYEYEVASSVQHPCVARPLQLVDALGQLALVFEDIGGQSIRELMQERPLELRVALEAARQVTMALACLHEADIVHRDVTPQNIIYSRQSGRAQLIDLGIASRLRQARPAAETSKVFEGTLAFVSPEQTWRLNRSVDARADLYSLGATLFMMLTGQVPFQQTDPAELMHAILAKMPTAPRRLMETVPQLVSDLIMTLLAKLPEERYQSAHGVQTDLATCLATLAADGSIEPFPLRREDHDEVFRLPEKLYGRDHELRALDDAFAQVLSSGKNAVVLITGNSGGGKTALVNGLQRGLLQHRALFASCKFDHLKRTVPYSALLDAFRNLIHAALRRSSQEVATLRAKLIGAVGQAGRVVTDVLPAFELLLGAQPPVHPLGPKDSESRFLVVLQEALRVFASADQPAVLFIDDLQWADPQSLEVLRVLCTPELAPYFLIIGAFRGNEVDSNHPLTGLLHTLEQQGAALTWIAIAPLTPEAVGPFLMDALHCEAAAAKPLAAQLVEKTGGNPFFIGEFLRHLQQLGLLRYVRTQRQWTWNLDEVGGVQVTDNVVDLLLGQMRSLSDATQTTLAVAACVGDTFDLQTVAVATQTPWQRAAELLWSAACRGIIVPLDDAYKYDGEHAVYRFGHDKVHQAALELVPEDARQKMHFDIGMLLLDNLSADQIDARIFELANHLGEAAQRVAPADLERVRDILLRAGRRARAANAVAVASQHLARANQLMPADAWRSCYALNYGLQLDLAECEDLSGSTDAADARMADVTSHCRDEDDRLAVDRRRIQLKTAKNQLEQAVALGVATLRRQGVRVPRRPGTLQIATQLLRAAWVRRGRSIESLADLPPMVSEVESQRLSILKAIAFPAFESDPSLFIWITLNSFERSVRHGQSAYTPSALCGWGIAAATALNRPGDAIAASHAVLKLMPRYGVAGEPSSLLMVVAGLLTHFDQDVRVMVARAEQSYRVGIETGQLDPAFRAACMVVAFQLMQGVPLASLLPRADDFLQTFSVRGDLISREVLLEYRQAIRALSGTTASPTRFDDADYREGQHRGVMEEMEAQSPLADFYSLKMQVAFFAGDLLLAEACGTHPIDFASELRGMPMLQQYQFYFALTCSQLLLRRAGERASERRRRLRGVLRPLRWWGQAGPLNYGNDLLLVEAEHAQVEGKPQAAQRLYERALAGYAAASCLHKAALTHELYARFCERQGFASSAEFHLREACAAYGAWGGATKLTALESDYPSLKQARRNDALSITSTMHATQSTTGAGDGANLDTAAILKATQSLSGEIVLARLVQKLLQNILAYVGAERATLVMRQVDTLGLVAESHVSDTAANQFFAPALPLTDDRLPCDLVRYVERTRESLVLDDATKHPEFGGGAYVQARKSKSILCVPILLKNELSGILIAENGLVSHAFDVGRVQLTGVLASQAAISMENAMLYAHQEELVERRTQELRDTQARLVSLEKEATEQQMAGGFAHEMRNTLSAAKNALSVAMGDAAADELSLDKQVAVALQALLGLTAQLPGAPRAEIEALEQQVSSLCENLGDIMSLTHESVQRALEVTTMIMEYSRLGLNRRGSDAVDLRGVVERIASEARAEMQAAHVTLHGQLAATHTFYGNEAHFYSVVRNLVNNARDALMSVDAERPRTITVELQRDGERLVLRVRDNGQGMSEAVQKRIFEPFFSTKPQTGMGLGLSMVRKLVALYDGEIRVDSQPDQGTTFTVTYPTAP